MHDAEDQKKREAVEAKNHAEQLVYTAEKALKDAGDKVPAELRKSVEDKIAAVKTANGGTDAGTIKSATDTLSSELSKIGEAISKSSGGQSAPNSGETKQSPNSENQNRQGDEGNIRDADFKEKK